MTREELRAAVDGGTARRTGHINYGKGGSGYLYQHCDFPRLTIIDRTQKKPVRVYCVDGVMVDDYDRAIDALLLPPVLTDAERDVLGRIEGRMRHRDILCSLAGIDPATAPFNIELDDPRQRYFAPLQGLRAKGFLICEGGVCWKRKGDKF